MSKPTFLDLYKPLASTGLMTTSFYHEKNIIPFTPENRRAEPATTIASLFAYSGLGSFLSFLLIPRCHCVHTYPFIGAYAHCAWVWEVPSSGMM